jgi:ribonuclease J
MNLLKWADKERPSEYRSNEKTQYIVKKTLERGERKGFGMVVRANDRFMPIVKDFVERYPEDTIMIYSMWSGYREKPNIKQMMELCKGHERTVHVSGHITKEDLEQVLDMVKPEKVIIHHTSACEKEEERLSIPTETELLHIADGEIIEI